MDAITGYEIFRDLITLFLAVTAVVGVAIYKILSSAIERKVTLATGTQLDKALLGSIISSGYDYWRDYDEHMDYLFSMDGVLEENWNSDIFSEELKNMFEKKGIPLSDDITITKENEDKWVITDKEKRNIFVFRKEEGKSNIYKKDIWNLGHAIETTELGYSRYASELDKRERESVWLICWVKNNLAYFYAERQKFGAAKPSDEAMAQRFVKYIHKRIDKYPEEKEAWNDTYKVVQKQFPFE